MGDEGAGVNLASHFDGEFIDVEPIARGGSGRVFRARDERLQRTVVIKVLDAVVLDGAERAASEARAQAAVSWHTNVLTILGEGVTRTGWPYLVLEDAEGGTLAERVETCGAMGVGDLQVVAMQLAEALAAAHEVGVVHCDVKPSNVLLARDGSVRLSDFGAAHTSRTATMNCVQGSLLYAPPELLEGGRPSLPNDVYSYGVTLHFALTGETPFGGADQPAATTIARVHSEELSFEGLGLSSSMAELLRNCVAKDPDQRPTIQAVVSALRLELPVDLALPGPETDVVAVVERLIHDRRAE